MSYLVTSEKYQSDEILIEEILIEIDGDEFELARQVEVSEADTLVVVQKVSGELEYVPDMQLEPSGHTVIGSTYSGSADRSSSIWLKFRAKGFAKARVIISQVRRGISKAFRGFPCKLCKLAVKTIVSTLLVHLGVPIAPTGEFDFKAFVAQVTNAAADFANGTYGQVVQALSGLLPSNWWTAVLNLLHAANWLMDATDAFFEKVCRLIRMCPPQPTPTTP